MKAGACAGYLKSMGVQIQGRSPIATDTGVFSGVGKGPKYKMGGICVNDSTNGVAVYSYDGDDNAYCAGGTRAGDILIACETETTTTVV